MNLNDVFPDGLMGEGIFYALNEYNVPWKTAISSVALDLEYYGNVSGGKTIAPLLRRLLVDGVIPQSALTRLANSLYSMNALRWSKLWNTYQLEYNPIENYRMTEIMENDDTVTTYGRTHSKTGTESDDRTRTDESTDGVFGFNSSSASDSETSDRTIDDDNTHTYNLSDADTGSDTQSRSYELTRSGNIGVTTSQQMIEAERALWMWKYFYDIVFPDIDRVLTISVYSDDVIPITTGGVTPTGEISITLNGTYDVTEYASADVQVPNTYTAADEGKVVDGGTLVAQSSQNITENGVYDTTLISSVDIDVDEGVTILSGTDAPLNSVGSDGDIYLQYGASDLDLSLFTNVNQSSMKVCERFVNRLSWTWVGGSTIGAYSAYQVDLTDVDYISYSIRSGVTSYNNYVTPRFAPLLFLSTTASDAADSDAASGLGAESRISTPNTIKTGVYDVSGYTGQYYIIFSTAGCDAAIDYIRVGSGTTILNAYYKKTGVWYNLIGTSINDI